MGNKLKKILLFLITIISITIFASEETKAPNELITENPEREVTTVESMKTRDHATMSLSVTKVVPEEIMGKLKDGKLSVFISKSKKEPRIKDKSMGNSNGIDISKLSLKAYSNPKTQKPMMLKMNLSAEDIKNMQREVSEKKKINVVENTDNYVRLEVENVNENEKVYISVMNGDKVVKSYRIGEITPYAWSWNECWGGVNGSMRTKNEIVQLDSIRTIPYTGGEVDYTYEIGVNNSNEISGLNRVEIGTKPTIGKILLSQDEFFTNKRKQVSGIRENTGIRIFRAANDRTRKIGGGSNNLRTTCISGEVCIGGEKTISIENSHFEYGRDEVLYFVAKNGKKYDSFYKLNIHDNTINLTCDSGIVGGTKGMFFTVPRVGFNLLLEFNGSNDPGVYSYPNVISMNLYSNESSNRYGWIEASYDIDFGDVTEAGYVFNVKSDSKTFYIPIGETISIQTSEDKALSFMKLNNNNNDDNRGIYYQSGSFYATGNAATDLNDIPSQVTLNGNFDVKSTDGNSTINVTVSQEKNKFAKLDINFRAFNSTGNSATFNFSLIQGRKVKGKFRRHRQVNYTITWNKPQNYGDIIFNIDSRIENGSGEWVAPNGDVKNYNGVTLVSLPEFVEASDGIEPNNKHTADIVNINGKSGNELGNDTVKKYKYIKNDGQNKLALPYSVSMNLYDVEDNNTKILINKEDLDNLNTKEEKTVAITKKNTFVLKADDSSLWGGTITENYYGNKNSASSSGSIDITDAQLNTEYVFAPGANNPQGKITKEDTVLTLTTTLSPDARGRLEKNKNDNIADEIVIENKTRSPQIIKLNNIKFKSGNKLEPQQVSALDNKVAIGISSDGGLIIKKLEDVDFGDNGKDIRITYKYQNIILGTFDLNIKSERKINTLTEMNFEVDSRIVSVTKGEWISPNGDVWDSNGNKIGSYPNFIRAYQSTKNNYADDIMVTKVTKINNTTSLSNNEKLNYSYLKESGNNNTALPYNVPISTYNTTDPNTKIIISKADLNTSKQVKATMEKRNTFELEDNKGEQWAGSLKEKYIDTKINNNGSGTLNLIGATLNKGYSFTAGQSGNITSGNEEERITLKVESGKKSLDATGVVTKTSENVANKMIVKVGNEKTNIVKSKKLETNILDDKVKIGINDKGELTVTKLKEENIEPAKITIDYYYDIDNDESEPSDGNFIKLGTFTLTLSNPVITSNSEITVKIDKRFLQAENTSNWLFKNGKVVQDILQDTNNGIDYSGLYKYEGNLQSQTGTIIKALGVEGREDRQQGRNYDGFKVRGLTTEKWRDEAAAPKTGQMSNIDNLVVVSKGNKKENPNLDNKFSLLYTDNDEKKIYKGNVKEEIVGSGKSDGNGSINIRDLEKGVKYIFPTTSSGDTVEGNNGSSKKVTMTISGTNGTPIMPNGKGESKIKDGVIANKITVDNTPNNGGLEVTKDSFTFGIDNTTGGVTIKNDNSQNLTEDKSYEIKFWYKPTNGSNPAEVLLSTFKLTIKKETFEIDGDSTLEFGKMFYRENAPFETRVKEFKVKNPENKNIRFSVNKESTMSLMQNQTINDNIDQIKLTNIAVQKKSDKAFELQATANLTKETKPGNYQGEIEVTVTITNEK